MDFGWEWKEEEKKWIPIMTTLLPALNAIIHLAKCKQEPITRSLQLQY